MLLRGRELRRGVAWLLVVPEDTQGIRRCRLTGEAWPVGRAKANQSGRSLSLGRPEAGPDGPAR